MDIQMPIINGTEAMAAIRREEQASGTHTPIIALTADALKGTAEELLSTGFDAYLGKPMKITALKEQLQQLTAGTNHDT